MKFSIETGDSNVARHLIALANALVGFDAVEETIEAMVCVVGNMTPYIDSERYPNLRITLEGELDCSDLNKMKNDIRIIIAWLGRLESRMSEFEEKKRATALDNTT